MLVSSGVIQCIDRQKSMCKIACVHFHAVQSNSFLLLHISQHVLICGRRAILYNCAHITGPDPPGSRLGSAFPEPLDLSKNA